MHFIGRGATIETMFSELDLQCMRRALTLEVGMQNAGLGTMLAFQFFKDHPAATVPTALYTFGCVFTAMLLAHVWSRQGGGSGVEG